MDRFGAEHLVVHEWRSVRNKRYVVILLAVAACATFASSAATALGHHSQTSAITPKRGVALDFPTIDVRCRLERNETNSGDELSCTRRSMETKATLGVTRTVVAIYDDSVNVLQSHPSKFFTAKRDP